MDSMSLETSISHLILQKRYVVVKEKKIYSDSSAHCESLGGSLALPDSAAENQQILEELGESMQLLFFCFILFFSAESC